MGFAFCAVDDGEVLVGFGGEVGGCAIGGEGLPLDEVVGWAGGVVEDGGGAIVLDGGVGDVVAGGAEEEVGDRVGQLAFIAVDDHERFFALVGGIDNVLGIGGEGDGVLDDPVVGFLFLAIDDDGDGVGIAQDPREAFLVRADDDFGGADFFGKGGEVFFGGGERRGGGGGKGEEEGEEHDEKGKRET